MFRKSILSSVAAIAFFASAGFAPASAASQWVVLGEQTAGFRTDRDIFFVDQAERFDALKFSVSGNRLAVADVTVFYGNGTSEHLNVKEHLAPGETTRAYDLAGAHRQIKRIEVLYETEGHHYEGRASLRIHGLKYDGIGGGGDHATGWEALGTTSVGFHVDHDVIPVGPGKGKFQTLRLKVSDHDIYMYNLRVRFLNGEVQEVPVNRHLAAGAWTPALDLSGDKRFIDRVDMVYRTRPGFYGQAHVTVFGKH
jgi:hypothetical protein